MLTRSVVSLLGLLLYVCGIIRAPAFFLSSPFPLEDVASILRVIDMQ